ncbi:MAG: recombinase family protein, partial [Clostridiales bacterium]|nr:recombinase family protein [Clostridiales bacterium]
MAVFRIEKTQNYTVMSNHHLRNTTLSLKAKGCSATLSHTCNFKTTKHFKDKKSHYVDESEWTIFENTHEPIIDQDTFDNVQRIRGNVRRYPDGWGEAHPLTG